EKGERSMMITRWLRNLARGTDPARAAGKRRLQLELLEGRDVPSTGAVFVATNHNNTNATAPDEPANQAVMYSRAEDGTLSLVGRFDTGGQGSGPSVRFAGDGLGSAHSVQLSQNGRFLFVTNAGSDSISVFKIEPTGLSLVDLEPTGDFPNSVTQSGDAVYVLNSAGEGSIGGHRFNQETRDPTPLPRPAPTPDANHDPTPP